MVVVLSVLLFFFFFLLFLIIWGPGKNLIPQFYDSEIHCKKNQTIFFPKDKFKILTWNMGYAQGLGSEGTEAYRVKSKEEFRQALDGIVTVLKNEDPDFCFIQEIDIDSGRSQHINQLEYIFEKTHFNYAAISVNWLANYVPFPYWPFSHHFGKVHSAGIILSRYPIVKSYYYTLEKPKNNPWWYNLFYLYRYFQVAEVIVGKNQFSLLNLHLEAFDVENREQQASNVSHYLHSHLDVEWLAIGGDFNSVPSYASNKEVLEGFYKDRRHEDKTLSYFEKISFLKNSLDRNAYLENEKQYFTFPCVDSNRMLDHIFVNKKLKVISKRVVLEAGQLSDHLPYVIEIGKDS